MIRDKIDKDDHYWQNILLHIELNEYIFALVTSDNIAVYVHDLIFDHRTGFKELYSCLIIPKMHYVVHYPEWISK